MKSEYSEVENERAAKAQKTRWNHAQRRNARRIASKMIVHSRAYILIMWNGDDKEEPMAIMDLDLISRKESIIAKVFGKIAHHTIAVLRAGKELLDTEAAEQNQAERAQFLKEGGGRIWK